MADPHLAAIQMMVTAEDWAGTIEVRSALGRARDEDYVDYFARVKREEWFRYHERVTPWEIREYLTRF